MHVAKAQARGTGAVTLGPGRNPGEGARGAQTGTASVGQTKAEKRQLLEIALERSNVWSAYHKVVRNRGSPGVDGLWVTQFKDWLKVHWPSVRVALLAGRYVPAAVRAVDIPKPRAGYGHWAFRRNWTG